MRLHNTAIRLVHIGGVDIGPGKTSDHIEDRPVMIGDPEKGGRKHSLHDLIEEAPMVRAGVVRVLRDSEPLPAASAAPIVPVAPPAPPPPPIVPVAPPAPPPPPKP